MFGVRQVGYSVGVGPTFVVPVGTESKIMILQCSVEQPKGWVTRVKAPEHVQAMNDAGFDRFPYTQDQCSIEGFENNQVVDLGVENYLLPNFAGDYNGWQNIDNDWILTSFKAPNLIRNKPEWDYYKGNSGTATSTTKKPTTKVPVSNAPTPNSGLLYLGIGVAFLFLLLIITKTN